MPKSALESLSEIYSSQEPPQQHQYWNNRIIDHTEKEILYVVPAGFTWKTDNGESRLSYYKALWEKSVSFGSENNLYPLGVKTHSIVLRQDKNNKYDPYAVKVGIVFNSEDRGMWIPQGFETNMIQDIGFIPKAISKQISLNIEMIKKVSLINVYAELQKSIYFGRIALSYSEQAEVVEDISYNSKRFSAILEE